MTILSSLAIVIIAGLIHASFQLSVSVLTLLSSHTIGHKRSHRRLVALTNSFTFGVGVMTMLLLSFAAVVLLPAVQNSQSEMLTWTIVCGFLGGLGLAVWFFYYRRHEPGTTLWIPREMARFLRERTKATKNPSEAFGLGLSSVLGELLFIFAPLAVAALALLPLEPIWQVIGIALYSFVSLLSLLIVNALIGSGHSNSRIQKWRESNKRFLQFAAGSGLLILGFYLYVEQVMTATVMAAAGSV